MSERKINLEEILDSICQENPHGDRFYPKDYIIKAMKQACEKVLELAAENVDITSESHTRLDMSCCCNYVEIDKQSILDVINLIE